MTALEQYVRDLTSPECIDFCAARSGVPPVRVRQRLADYVGEVGIGVRLLESVPLTGGRVLEIGAGLGLLAVWLKRQGVSIVLLEPGEGGFDENRRLLNALLEWLDASDAVVLSIGAEELDAEHHGRFDVIFSVNVLEHIPRLESALAGMLRVLAPGGVMRHTCPNYAVPYEPHYGMPLVPLIPRATSAVVRSLRDQPLWRSLNFVTYQRIVRFCGAEGLACRFDRGLLAEAFTRVESDPAFRARRGPAVRTAARLLRASGAVSLLRTVPPRWATPMAFTCWRTGDRTSRSTITPSPPACARP
jgi:2-polyprenyl-3-methyl-5-hydroxy-6-metoxy-1,4-benzoquinol methylase